MWFAVAPNFALLLRRTVFRDENQRVGVERVGVEQRLRCDQRALRIRLAIGTPTNHTARNGQQEAHAGPVAEALEMDAIVEARGTRRDHGPGDRDFDIRARERQLSLDDAT